MNDKKLAHLALLQQIMHYHGLEEFQQMLKQAYYDASEDTQDISKEMSEKYESAAHQLEDLH